MLDLSKTSAGVAASSAAWGWLHRKSSIKNRKSLCHCERSETISLHHSLFLVRHSIFTTTFTFLLLLFLIATPAYAKYGGGTGEPNDPYLIFDANQMNAIGADSNDWDKHFLLCADIDLSSYTGPEPPPPPPQLSPPPPMADIDLGRFTDTEFNIIGYFVNWGDNKPFSGVFDGNGHTISNFTYSSTGTNCIGLFGYVRGEIKDLGLINPDVDAGSGDKVGSLVGRLRDGTITSCYAEGGSVSGHENVGGLVGHNQEGTISNSYSTGSVAGRWPVGGLVGYNSGTISNCYATASVSGDWHVGGLVGTNIGTITNCYSLGSVSGDDYVGGLVGVNGSPVPPPPPPIPMKCSNSRVDELTLGEPTATFQTNNGVSIIGGYASFGEPDSHGATINNCYASGDVSGDRDVGGLVGLNWEGTITNCYSTGYVAGNYDVGGLVGYNWEGEVTNSFWDIETSGQNTSDGGTGLPTVEMQMASTFFVWACSGGSVWTIDEGNDYPRLWWEDMPGEPITIPSYGGGSGEPNDPYLIYTAEQLNTIGLIECIWDKHFLLCADIDLAGYTGTAFNIIGISYTNPFTGVFDGNGHIISNFNYTSTDRNYVGLFGYVKGEDAEIKNLGLIDPNVDAGTGDHIGSLVGQLSGATITNCYVEGGNISGDYAIGGLVGYNYGTITNCYSTGSVSGTGYSIGGLVGWNRSGTITNCYSTGSVSGNSGVGGLVGYNSWGTITNCYATGSVAGGYDSSYLGGLCGYKYKGTISNCFWDIETSGRTTSAGGTGLPTAEMQTMSAFTDAGWDFVGETLNGIEDIWFIPQQDYPHLWWEGMQVLMKLTPRTLNCRSKGNWVKAHITLPEGFTVADVEPNRPAVLHSFGFASAPLYVFVNENKLVEIEAAFEREAVCSLAGDWPETLTVAGFLTDGNIFLGTSTVRMITPGLKDIAELSLYWLNADCAQPDWCDGIDLNRDSLVNLLDYALLLNSQVEFVSE